MFRRTAHFIWRKYVGTLNLVEGSRIHPALRVASLMLSINGFCFPGVDEAKRKARILRQKKIDKTVTQIEKDLISAKQ